MNTPHYTRKIRSLFGKGVFLGYGLIFIGLAVFIFSALFEYYEGSFYIGGTIGLLIVLLGLLLSFSYYGVAIRTDERRIRNYKSYMGFKSGSWEPLPKYEKVVVEKVSPTEFPSFKGISPAIRWYKVCYIVVLSGNNKAQIVSVKPDADLALADAEALGQKLRLKVEDQIRVEA